MADPTSKTVNQRLIEALNLALKHVRCDRDCGSSSYRDGIRSCGCGKAQDARQLFSLFTDDDWKLIRAGQSPDETAVARDARGFPLAKPGIPIEARCAACQLPLVSLDGEWFMHDCECMREPSPSKTSGNVTESHGDA